MSMIKNMNIDANIGIDHYDKIIKQVSIKGGYFDLFQNQIARLIEEFWADSGIKVDSLSVGTATVHNCLHISSLSELQAFINNLNAYCEQQQPNNPLQSISEYIACYDQCCHDIHPHQVIDSIPDTIQTCYHRDNKPKDLVGHHGFEVAKDWFVVFK